MRRRRAEIAWRNQCDTIDRQWRELEAMRTATLSATVSELERSADALAETIADCRRRMGPA